jgi:hypothetical protein
MSLNPEDRRKSGNELAPRAGAPSATATCRASANAPVSPEHQDLHYAGLHERIDAEAATSSRSGSPAAGAAGPSPRSARCSTTPPARRPGGSSTATRSPGSACRRAGATATSTAIAETVWALIVAAREAHRPELRGVAAGRVLHRDAPRRARRAPLGRVDLDRGRILVAEQFNAAPADVHAPKNGRPANALLTPPAREALLGSPRTSRSSAS